MRASSQRSPIGDQAPTPDAPLHDAETANIARGGVVAEWHRAIEQRYASAYPSQAESRGERILREVSRFGGVSALLLGYSVILYLIVT